MTSIVSSSKRRDRLLARLRDLPAAAREYLLRALQAIQAEQSPAEVRDADVGLFSLEDLERLMETTVDKLASGKRRVVITGMGAITAVGRNAEETWRNLLAGQSGIDYVTLFDASPYPTRIAAEVKNWDPTLYLPRKDARRMARCS